MNVFFLVFILFVIVGWGVSVRFAIKDERVQVEAFDGRRYLVRDVPDKKATADMMASLNAKVIVLLNYLRQDGGRPVMVARLVARYKPEVLAEGRLNKKLTSYTVNKGESVVMCMRSRDGSDALYPENVLFSVLLHELAHIASLSQGHGGEFTDNLRFLTEKAGEMGLLKRQKVAVNYCGIPLSHV